jgi:HEAT repeat protein
VRAAAAAALARIDDRDAVEPLLEALHDPDPWVRYFAVRSIAVREDAALAPAVLELVEGDPAGQVRAAAIETFGRLTTTGSVAVLGPLAGAPDPDAARAAIRALGHTKDSASGPVLAGLLRAAEPWRRTEAVVAVGARGEADAASTLQRVAATDSDPGVADAAVAALAHLASLDGPEAGAATAALISLAAEPARRESTIRSLAALPSRRIADVANGLRHRSPDVRRATIEALGRMRHPDASRSLEAALDDTVPAVRSTAVTELRRLGSRHAERRLLALARTDPDGEVRHAGMMAVTRQGGDLPALDRAEAL